MQEFSSLAEQAIGWITQRDEIQNIHPEKDLNKYFLNVLNLYTSI